MCKFFIHSGVFAHPPEMRRRRTCFGKSSGCVISQTALPMHLFTTTDIYMESRINYRSCFVIAKHAGIKEAFAFDQSEFTNEWFRFSVKPKPLDLLTLNPWTLERLHMRKQISHWSFWLSAHLIWVFTPYYTHNSPILTLHKSLL